jgi:hypothetical protein
VVLKVDDEQRYTMGVYLCLNGVSIHNANLDDAISFDTLMSFEKIHEEQHSLIYFSQSSHKIKKKAEQVACAQAIALTQNSE